MYVFKSETVPVRTQLLNTWNWDYKYGKSQISETGLYLLK